MSVSPRIQGGSGSKKGILLVAFGPGNAQSTAALRTVQSRAEKQFGMPVRWAFTSDAMRERLARERTKSDSVLKALRRMRYERYAQVAVQSLHLIPGLEYADVQNDVRQAESEGALRASVGLPLLVTEADAQRAAHMLLRHLPPQRTPAEAVVCMAHGSRHEAERLYDAWGRSVEALDPGVFVACMKGSVTLDTVIPRLRVMHPARVWLLPLLSVVGKHTLQDMAGARPSSVLAPRSPSWQNRLEDAGFACTADLRGLADGSEFLSSWMDRLADALAELDADGPSRESNTSR